MNPPPPSPIARSKRTRSDLSPSSPADDTKSSPLLSPKKVPKVGSDLSPMTLPMAALMHPSNDVTKNHSLGSGAVRDVIASQIKNGFVRSEASESVATVCKRLADNQVSSAPVFTSQGLGRFFIYAFLMTQYAHWCQNVLICRSDSYQKVIHI